MTPGQTKPIGEPPVRRRRASGRGAAQHDEILKRYGFTRETAMRMKFDASPSDSEVDAAAAFHGADGSLPMPEYRPLAEAAERYAGTPVRWVDGTLADVPDPGGFVLLASVVDAASALRAIQS